MKIKKLLSKILVTSLLAITLTSPLIASASDVVFDASGTGYQSGIWAYTNADAYASGSINITDLGTFYPYQIGYNVLLSGDDADEASTATLYYKIYEKEENVVNNIVVDGFINYRSESFLASGTVKEYGCDDVAILKLEFDGNTKYLKSICE